MKFVQCLTVVACLERLEEKPDEPTKVLRPEGYRYFASRDGKPVEITEEIACRIELE